jgi:hypothetical protein
MRFLEIEIQKLSQVNDWIKIGSGQFGQIFKGIYKHDEINKFTVAIKVYIIKKKETY